MPDIVKYLAVHDIPVDALALLPNQGLIVLESQLHGAGFGTMTDEVASSAVGENSLNGTKQRGLTRVVCAGHHRQPVNGDGDIFKRLEVPNSDSNRHLFRNALNDGLDILVKCSVFCTFLCVRQIHVVIIIGIAAVRRHVRLDLVV